jgi:hypothetical protein
LPLTLIYFDDVMTKTRKFLIDSPAKAVLLIKSWMGHLQAERWEMELKRAAEDVVVGIAGQVSGAKESVEF